MKLRSIVILALIALLSISCLSNGNMNSFPAFSELATEDVLDYKKIAVQGWNVHMRNALYESAIAEEVYFNLSEDLAKVLDLLPQSSLDYLQTVNIWIEDDDYGIGAVYHVDVNWLLANNYPPEMAQGIHIKKGQDYLDWTADIYQPAMILHELSHAWHHYRFNYDHKGIIEAYEAAKATGRYEDAYAMTNNLEYFAELTEAYYWKNDFYPFIRSELEEFDPEGLKVVLEMWYVDE